MLAALHRFYFLQCNPSKASFRVWFSMQFSSQNTSQKYERLYIPSDLKKSHHVIPYIFFHRGWGIMLRSYTRVREFFRFSEGFTSCLHRIFLDLSVILCWLSKYPLSAKSKKPKSHASIIPISTLFMFCWSLKMVFR